MARHERVEFSEQECQQFHQERYRHPHPRVQQRMEVMWLLSQGETHERAAQLAGVSRTTVHRYLVAFRQGGFSALQELHWEGPTSDLETHRLTLEAEFRQRPPHTVAQAAARIEELTGIHRAPTQTRAFLRSLGLGWRRVAALPVPPKKTSNSTSASKPPSWPPNWSPV
jgi:transposase